jgi:hypothetical protein
MSTKSVVALACYLLVIFRLVAEGMLSLSGSKMMSYHRQIMGVDWSTLEPGVRTMLLAFCRLEGALMLATALLMGILLFVLFRRGEEWARWLGSGVGLVFLAPAVVVSMTLAISTDVATPWPGNTIAVMLLITGFLLSRDLTRGTTIR